MIMSKNFVMVGLILLLALSGCGTPATTYFISSTKGPVITPAVTQQGSETSVVPHTLTVYAAASLTGAFQEIGNDFEAANPGVNVIFSFAGSQILRTQLEQGAIADVFASADHKNLDMLVTDNLVAPNTYQDFTTNKLVVILPAGNPGDVQTLSDLAKPDLKLVLADASVPAGNYARQTLTKMSTDPIYGSDFSTKILANVVSNETDVKQVVAKVELGEADAGIVYISDAVAAPDLLTISIPDAYNVIAEYPIATLTKAPERDQADAFVSYILSPTGQSVLHKWGFKGVTR
jgi:molybdate transport system substrate-binding protein